MKVLVTRPEPGASATASLISTLGFEPVLAPCLMIESLDSSLPENPAAILVTSGHAIAALPARFHGIPCFCVGDATAAKMRMAGFGRVTSASGDAADLLQLVVAQHIGGTHLLATGAGHGIELARQLRGRGIKLLRRTVYASHPLPALPPTIRHSLAGGEIAKALFYSAETAKAFIRLQPPGTLHMEALTLSPAVAAATQGLPWRTIRVAVAPNEMDLLALLHEPGDK